MVGQRAAIPFNSSSSDLSPLLVLRPPITSATLGVGHALIASVSVVPECLPLSVEYAAAPEDFESMLVAVGQDEEPLAQVRRANVGRGEQTPLRIEPVVGKVAKDLGEPKANVPRDVLEEGERRVALEEDAEHVGPEMPFVLLAASLARDGKWLAQLRVPGEDEVNLISPPGTVNLLDVSAPNRSAIQRALFLASQENGRREELPLDVHHSPASGNREA